MTRPDAVYIRIQPEGTQIARTIEVHPGVVLDLHSDDTVIGVELYAVRAQAEAVFRTKRHED
jgi:uncharacterized protein YuzE